MFGLHPGRSSWAWAKRSCKLLHLIVWIAALASSCRASSDSWQTLNHEPGYCAMYGVCGLRKDKAPLSCSNNTRAVVPDDTLAQKLQTVCPTLWNEQGGESGRYCCTSEQVERISTDTKQALPFIVGCPACHHNFIHFWCVMVCSPDQATWTNVTDVAPAYSNNVTAVVEVDYWMSESFGTQLFDSCKEVKFGAFNTPSMTFIGGGAKTYQAWLDFLGLVKDKRRPPIGSPFQQNFLPENATPPGMAPMSTPIPSCGDTAFRCSCADCSTAPGCSQPPDEPPKDETCKVGQLLCSDVVVWTCYLAILVASAAVIGVRAYVRSYDMAVLFGFRHRHGSLEGEPLVVGADLLGSPDDSQEEEPFPLEEEALYDDEDDEAYYPWAERHLQKAFYKLGGWCVRDSRMLLCVALMLVAFCLMGFVRFRVETDPQKLWVGPSSQAARDKAHFDAAFGPFYRVEQLILTTTPTHSPTHNHTTPTPILSNETLELLFDMQDEVDKLAAPYSDADGVRKHATLSDICYKPFGEACATQSVLQYWQMSRDEYRRQQVAVKQMKAGAHSPSYCLQHWYTECRSAFEAPMDPHIALGGFPQDASFQSYMSDATTYVVTYPVSSSPDNKAAAVAWEKEFIHLARTKLQHMAKAAGLSLAFSAERSIQDELERESTSDAATVATSYGVMLLYVSLALSSLPQRASLRDITVASRTSLGFVGVLIVATSVVCALGLVSMFGLWSTLIIMEVIPFLVLAVGVDNMFVLAHAMQRQDRSKDIAERAALALSQAGPSIFLAASCEVVAFALGALTPMPAVRNFSVCAALAVLVDFVLQVTVFMSFLAADTVRLDNNLPDFCPCIIFPSRQPSPRQQVSRSASNEFGDYDPLLPDDSPTTRDRLADAASLQKLLQWYMERMHAPFLAKKGSQALVLLIFLTSFCWSVAMMPRISVGLDQAVALPRDSYLQGYFKEVMSQLRVGPPLFVVVRNLHVSKASPDVNRVCSISGCQQDSLLTQISQAAARPHSTYIATPAASWVDDFLSWMRPELSSCCRRHSDASQCPPPDQPPCSQNATECADCQTCFTMLPDGRPEESDTKKLLPWFLNSKPSAACAKGGAGVYSDSIKKDTDDPTGIAGLSSGIVSSSAFRTYHTPLSKQQDFIAALSAIRTLVAKLRHDLQLDVYAYSIFHVFFEQYLSTGSTAVVLLGCPLLAVFLVCFLLTGSLWAGGVMMGVLVSLLVHLAGAMYLGGMQLNAVSLVNLAMSLGIAVEFTAHITHAFCLATGTRIKRAQAALLKMGASVLSGITLTKFAGVAVLGFAQTQIFEVYYFRLYLALVILGAAHGLVLLPVLLALVGPPSWLPTPEQRMYKLVVTPVARQHTPAGAEASGLTAVQHLDESDDDEGGDVGPAHI